ncbi:MAG: radical SAM protein [Spirochaetia bacterium]|nr:radical SAM protein [Spirochaetia bacterium]
MNIAWIGLHKGEEPPISKEIGSGTIFFTGCSLHCPFCQNEQISSFHTTFHTLVSEEELASYMIELQDIGAATINLITGTHFIPSIRESLIIAKERGLTIPIVWNSSGFESIEGLALIDDLIDLYLIDIKTLDEKTSVTYCSYKQYPNVIRDVVDYLIALDKRTYVDEEGSLFGLLIRHLVFPSSLKSTYEVLDYFSTHLKERAHLSLMVQFINPKERTGEPYISEKEYNELLDYLDKLGIEDGYVQELEDNVDWIPDFSKENPFPPHFASPLASFLEKRGTIQ